MKSSTSFVPGGELPVLLERIERREQSARRRTLLYSLLPVTLTVVLLGYTATTVQTATRQVDSLKTEATTYTTRIDTSKKDAESSKAQAQSLQTELENYKNQVTELQTQLTETQKALSDAASLSRAVRPIDSANAKELAARFPGSESLLLGLLDLRQRRIKFKAGGQSLQEGLDSAGFAMYMLRQKRAAGSELRPGETLADASRELYNRLPTTSQPRTGDLVFYPSGYAMFYFEDRQEGSFALGMTPLGISALKSDFAKPVGYRQVQLP
jgi:hypothetical protein